MNFVNYIFDDADAPTTVETAEPPPATVAALPPSNPPDVVERAAKVEGDWHRHKAGQEADAQAKRDRARDVGVAAPFDIEAERAHMRAVVAATIAAERERMHDLFVGVVAAIREEGAAAIADMREIAAERAEQVADLLELVHA